MTNHRLAQQVLQQLHWLMKWHAQALKKTDGFQRKVAFEHLLQGRPWRVGNAEVEQMHLRNMKQSVNYMSCLWNPSGRCEHKMSCSMSTSRSHTKLHKADDSQVAVMQRLQVSQHEPQALTLGRLRDSAAQRVYAHVGGLGACRTQCPDGFITCWMLVRCAVHQHIYVKPPYCLYYIYSMHYVYCIMLPYAILCCTM